MKIDRIYFSDSNLPEVLSKEAMDDLFDKMKQGDNASWQKLVEHNIKLVIYRVSLRFRNVDYDKNDLISIGIIGLINAINTFDTSKNIAFSSYAVRCIDNEILLFLRRLKKQKLEDSFEKTVTYDENGTVSRNEDYLEDQDVNLIENYERKELMLEIRKQVDNLPFRDREIVKLYFGFYDDKRYRQSEIGLIFGINRSSVSRILKKAVTIVGKNLERQQLIEKREESEQLSLTLKK